MMYEDRVLRRIFGPKREAGENFIVKIVLCALCSSITIKIIKSRKMRLAGT
jgi:hypothetical protein